MSSGSNQPDEGTQLTQGAEETAGETTGETVDEAKPPDKTATDRAVRTPDSAPDTGLSAIRQEIGPLLEDPKYDLLDEYWLQQPFSYAAIFRNTETEKQLYHVIEPELSEAESTLYQYLIHALKDQLLYRTDL